MPESYLLLIIGEGETDNSICLPYFSSQLDNPDYTIIKFIRARKLSIDNAIKMFIECLKWRIETDVDSIIAKGDLGFINQEGNDGQVFKRQISSGQTYVQGFDKQGGPVAYVFARYYRAGEQSPKAMEGMFVLLTVVYFHNRWEWC